MKTRSVDKHKYRNYLVKADEFFDMMNDSFAKRKFNPTVLNAIHCAINSADALTVFYKGVRHAGERHEDVVALLNTLGLPDMQSKNRQLLDLLRIKNSAEYEEKLMTETNALDSIKNAERFFKWVRDMLKE
ncbi:HEPN domain-containing protein [Candidatus Woesearchaeota archaeon]|nr:HEPN domain-containing protein [Candidatus Woesearchaeota archaeon]